jgi:hypothetical protein
MLSKNCFHGKEMNTVIVKSIPPGDFEEINVYMPDWQTRFHKLVEEEKPIKYDVYTMPNLPKEIQDELGRRGYRHLILDNDKDQHFLYPKAK